MSTDQWDDLSRRWREVYETQAEIAKGWLEGQAQLASTLVGAGGSVDPAADAAAMADVWRSSMALGGLLTRGMSGAESGGVASDMLGRMLNPMSMTLVGGTEVGDIIRRMTEGPRFADVGAIERRMADVMSRYVAVQTATRAYESVVASAWATANQRFASDITGRQLAGQGVGKAKDALAAWMDIANEALLETHRSPEFLTAQRELLRAAMDYLLAERGLVEQLLEPAGLPTRSELDEVHQTVQLLKRRVRALERAAATGAGPAPARESGGGTRAAKKAGTAKKTARRVGQS